VCLTYYVAPMRFGMRVPDGVRLVRLFGVHEWVGAHDSLSLRRFAIS
jgi:hypothetical protein